MIILELFLRYPYNWKTPTSYLFTMILQTVQFFNAVLIIILILGFFVTCCEFIVVLVNDIKEHLHDINEDIKNQCGKLSHLDRIEVDRKLRSILRFHGEFLQLSLFYPSCDRFQSSLIFFFSESHAQFRNFSKCISQRFCQWMEYVLRAYSYKSVL